MLELLARGDRSAEQWLVEHFRPRILTFFEARLRDPDLAQELCHDVLVAVLVRFRSGQVKISESVASYVFGVTRNIFADHLRQRINHKTIQFAKDFDTAAASADFVADNSRQRVRQAIAQLPPLDRQILTMTLVDGYKPGEIAAQLSLSPDVVRQRKTRAIRKLTNILGGPSRNATET